MDIPRSSQQYVTVTLTSGLEVVCDTWTDGGGWLVIQRRQSADLDFYRDWKDYKFGFSDAGLDNLWLGLDKIHQLTLLRRYQLRVDLSYKSRDTHALYDQFSVLGEDDNYEIRLSGYSGDAGDSMGNTNGFPFSTKDRDNDNYLHQCAVASHGAWWYHQCQSSNLNGQWGSKNYSQGVNWQTVTTLYDSADTTQMAIRPVTWHN